MLELISLSFYFTGHEGRNDAKRRHQGYHVALIHVYLDNLYGNWLRCEVAR